MKVVISGGTGLVGKRLQNYFKMQQAEIIILTTSNEEKVENGIRYTQWMNGEIPTGLENADAFINLAGVSLNDGRWTETQKEKILSSRIDTTNEMIRIINSLSHKPPVLINASAVGIYTPSIIKVYDEDSQTKVNDFLSEVVSKWEDTVSKANDLGVRTCFMRFGVIIEKDNGAFPMMLAPYKYYVGGTIGSGQQWVSWVHAEDVARAIAFAIEHDELNGPINTVAPQPLRMAHVGQVIAEVFDRPNYFPVPSFALKLALGEKSTLVLEGQNVIPKRLLDAGFDFKFPTLNEALIDLYKS